MFVCLFARLLLTGHVGLTAQVSGNEGTCALLTVVMATIDEDHTRLLPKRNKVSHDARNCFSTFGF